jgi:drug/metabolite transporter (DMT)-like permease
MIYLILVSLLWAFSFGIIKHSLSGVNPSLTAFLRLGISTIVFSPFLKLKGLSNKHKFRFMLTGGVQYGIMYVAYISSFEYLQAYEVAVLTIFTPLYVIFFSNLFQKKFSPEFFFASLLAIIGAGVIIYRSISWENALLGFFLMQIANMSFAFGQVFYKKIMAEVELKDAEVFALLYLGSAIVSFLFLAPYFNMQLIFSLTSKEISAIVYLGAVASGIGFFLWNYGARKVNDGTLAVFNNLKIPFSIGVSILFFGEVANLPRLVIGSVILGVALYLCEKQK